MDKEIHIENIEQSQLGGYCWLVAGGHPNGNSGSVDSDLVIKHFIPGPDNPLHLLDMVGRPNVRASSKPKISEK